MITFLIGSQRSLFSIIIIKQVFYKQSLDQNYQKGIFCYSKSFEQNSQGQMIIATRMATKLMTSRNGRHKMATTSLHVYLQQWAQLSQHLQ